MTNLSEIVGASVTGRYLRDASQVAVGEDYFDIIAESDDYIALFKPGRSVYVSGQGSEYEPARIYFCEIHFIETPVDGRGEVQIKMTIHLDAPIRRR